MLGTNGQLVVGICVVITGILVLRKKLKKLKEKELIKKRLEDIMDAYKNYEKSISKLRWR